MTLASIALSALASPVVSWKALSFVLVLILALVIIVTALSVISAILDMVVYAGGVALILAALFYFVDALSFSGAWEYLSSVLPMVVVAV